MVNVDDSNVDSKITLRQSWQLVENNWGILLSSPGISVFNQALAALRPRCRALMTPQTLVLDAGGGRKPLVEVSSMPRAAVDEQFSGAVAGMFGLLDKVKVRGRCLHVAISDQWTRPLALTLPGKPENDKAIDTLVIGHYRKIYGDLMDNWRWCWSQHGSRLVAVALPACGLDALQIGLARRDCVLSIAKPLGLMLGRQLGNEPGACWLVILMRLSATLMRLESGVLHDWCVVSGAADPASLAEQLPMQLGREAARCDDGCRAVVIIDFEATVDLVLVRKNLMNAGWASRVCASNELSATWVWRLQQLTRSQKTS